MFCSGTKVGHLTNAYWKKLFVMVM